MIENLAMGSLAYFQYSCQCPCYNSKQSCKAKCRCENCSNPFGVREKQAPNFGSKRKRTPHESQKFPLQVKKTKTFMEAIGEPLSTGGFSDLEFLSRQYCSLAGCC